VVGHKTQRFIGCSCKPIRVLQWPIPSTPKPAVEIRLRRVGSLHPIFWVGHHSLNVRTFLGQGSGLKVWAHRV
jgi:hypothetical protein